MGRVLAAAPAGTLRIGGESPVSGTVRSAALPSVSLLRRRPVGGEAHIVWDHDDSSVRVLFDGAGRRRGGRRLRTRRILVRLVSTADFPQLLGARGSGRRACLRV